MEIFLIFTLVAFAVSVVLLMRENNRLVEELETYGNLAKQAESLYEDFRKRTVELHREIERRDVSVDIIHAEYCTSESDYTKFSSDEAMLNVIKSRLAMILANDIIKKVGEPELSVSETTGNNLYSYRIKLEK